MSFPDAKRRNESRRFGRRDTNFTGWIRIPDRSSLICTVRNVSIGGALLECEHALTLPFRFELYIPATGTSYPCEVRHQSPTSVGVEFCAVRAHDATESRRTLRHGDGPAGGEPHERPVRNVAAAVRALRPARGRPA